jgi:hypothetical protein
LSVLRKHELHRRKSPSMVPAEPVNEPGGRTQHRFGISCQLMRVATGEVDSYRN